MFYLFTGAPGAGKTLNAIKFILDNSSAGKVFADRQIVAAGVNGLNIEGWKSIDLEEGVNWYTYPAGTVFLIDECQEIWPMGSSGGKVPDTVAKMARHRHMGFDVIATCQFPRQLHTGIRAVVNEHRHLSRKFGTSKVMQFTWGRIEENPNKSKTGAQSKLITLDKSIFDKYKSACLLYTSPSPRDRG